MKLAASRISAVVALLGHAIALSASAADIGDARPLIESHCFDCHGNGASEGNLSLDALLAADDSPAVRSQWRKVWKMVRQGFMPPADAEPLARDDRQAITQWIEQASLGVDYDDPDPGRVTMRRLNRMEYEFTVNDLFGLDVTVMEDLSSLSQGKEKRLRDMLPPDDTAYGFDNIGDFQTLSPALLEKYFEIAELIVSKVIVTDGPWYPVSGGPSARRSTCRGTARRSGRSTWRGSTWPKRASIASTFSSTWAAGRSTAAGSISR